MKTVADFDSAMSRVAAVSGATGSDFDSLRDKAREMGAKTKFSATEAADAMNYMAMAGWKTEDMLSGIEGVMYLDAASGEDLATTSDIVIAAIAALVAAFIYLWNTNEEFQQFWIRLWNEVKEVAVQVWTAVSFTLKEM